MVGFTEKEKISRIRELLREMADTNFVSGVSCMVLLDGEECFYGEAGFRDIEARVPLTRDTIFRIYSMTKPVTSTAVMILLEEGKIDLLDNVARYLPGFSNPYLIENGKVLSSPVPVTIRDLLNMTSGVPYPGEGNAAEIRANLLMEEIKEKHLTKSALSTVEIANRAGQNPLAFCPGSTWQYGFSADILGAVVEVVSGMTFGEFLRRRIFEPLGMNDTGFYVPKEKQDRLAKVYRTTEQGLVLYTLPNLGIQNEMKQKPAFESGGAGLVSTIDDYAKFATMLLKKGTLGDVRILSPKTVEFMTGGHLTPAQQKGLESWESLSGYSYANLMRIMDEPGRSLSLGSAGEYGWDGWLGTYFTNDSANKLTLLIMHQKVDSGTTEYTRRIRNVIYSAL